MTKVASKPPHAAQFHVHAVGGTCPVCYVAEAQSWDDLLMRLDTAKEIAQRTLDVQSDIVLGHVRSSFNA